MYIDIYIDAIYAVRTIYIESPVMHNILISITDEQHKLMKAFHTVSKVKVKNQCELAVGMYIERVITGKQAT